MKWLPLACAALPLLVAGCAETVATTDASAALATDASAPTADAPAAAVDATPACPPRSPAPPVPAACADLTELAAPRNAVPGVVPGLPTYAMTTPRAATRRERPSCVVRDWQDGAEAMARFTAPTGGRWRLTARGLHLGALRATRGCATGGACAGFADYHGPFVSAVRAVDVQAQRGEAFAVTVDGCPEGETCDYELRAERLGDLACAFTSGDAPPCAEGTACTVDACDPERFACLPAARDRLESARALVDRAGSRGYVLGRLRALPAGTARLRPPLVMVEWRRPDGTLARTDYLTGDRSTGPSFSVGPTQVPAEVSRARLWLYDAEVPTEAAVAEGIEVAVEPWAPGVAGARCDDATLVERCDEGLRCAGATCARQPALEVTGLRAWRDPTGGSLRLRIEGLGLGETVTQASVELLDAAGALLAALPASSLYSQHAAPSQVPFTSLLVLDGTNAALPRAARVRVRVTDTSSRTSAPVEAPVEATATAPVGAACTDPSTACGDGLACVTPPSGGARCEPALPRRVCDLGQGVGTWAPPSAGAWSIEGITLGTGGIASCFASRTSGTSVAEFVAPTRGRYAFQPRGLSVFDVDPACDGGSTAVCARAPGETPVSVDLAAGQRVRLTMMTEAPERPFAVRVLVP